MSDPTLCSHVSNLLAGLTTGSHPIPCRAPATHVVDGQHNRCADHLVVLLDGSPGRTWDVRRLEGPMGFDIDAILTSAGASCALGRLQYMHASLADRIRLVIAQRDQLQAALSWLDEDIGRLDAVKSEIERLRQIALDTANKRTSFAHSMGRTTTDPELYAAMYTPTIGQVIYDLAGDGCRLNVADHTW